MNVVHLDAMRAGREAATARRQAAEDRIARDYLTFIRREAQAFSAYRQAATDHTNGLATADEVRDAWITWREVTAHHPGVPTDAAMRRVREDLYPEDAA